MEVGGLGGRLGAFIRIIISLFNKKKLGIELKVLVNTVYKMRK